MVDNLAMCLIGAMDRLWFHQVIIFSEPTSLFVHNKLLKPPKAVSLPNQSSSPPLAADQETTVSNSSAVPTKLDDSNSEEVEEDQQGKDIKARPTRSSLCSRRLFRSHSSSPTTQKQRRRSRHQPGEVVGIRLQKSMSCWGLKELELEEVKGFADLGFVFKKEHMSPRMMSLLPGLQRLGLLRNKRQKEEEEEEEAETERGIRRPYLSEAWLIKRPDSPLLNLKLPRVNAAADMKKHLRFWARTVASVLQQEC